MRVLPVLWSLVIRPSSYMSTTRSPAFAASGAAGTSAAARRTANWCATGRRAIAFGRSACRRPMSRSGSACATTAICRPRGSMRAAASHTAITMTGRPGPAQHSHNLPHELHPSCHPRTRNGCEKTGRASDTARHQDRTRRAEGGRSAPGCLSAVGRLILKLTSRQAKGEPDGLPFQIAPRKRATAAYLGIPIESGHSRTDQAQDQAAFFSIAAVLTAVSASFERAPSVADSSASVSSSSLAASLRPSCFAQALIVP